MKRNKAIIVASAIIVTLGLFTSQATKVYADTVTTTQVTDEQTRMVQMKATIDSLQKTISELAVKVREKQAAAPVRNMTLPEIAAQVQRIAKEKEVLAQKVQIYVAAHPQTASIAQAAPSSATNTNAKIAEIKKEIAELTAKLMAQKAIVSTETAAKETTTAKTEQPAKTPAQTVEQPAQQSVEQPAEAAKGVPEITITPEGEIATNGQKPGVTVTTESPKKGLFQSIADYIKTLFKF